jgi:hypothetical protein
MNQHTLKDINAAAQVHPTKSSRFIPIGERTLQTFTALTQQPAASACPNPASIRVTQRHGRQSHRANSYGRAPGSEM